jgi:hypothetical protein
MGVHLPDYLELEDLARHCERTGRWEFLFAAAPLRIPGGTGSPVDRSRASEAGRHGRSARHPSRLATTSRYSSTQSTSPPGSRARNESIASDSSSGVYSEKVE